MLFKFKPALLLNKITLYHILPVEELLGECIHIIESSAEETELKWKVERIPSHSLSSSFIIQYSLTSHMTGHYWVGDLLILNGRNRATATNPSMSFFFFLSSVCFYKARIDGERWTLKFVMRCQGMFVS